MLRTLSTARANQLTSRKAGLPNSIHRLAVAVCVALVAIFATMTSGVRTVRADGAPANTVVADKVPAVWWDLNAQGVALSAKGRFAEALLLLNRALAACDAAGDQGTHCVALVSANTCLALTKLNRVEDALPSCSLSLDALREDRSPGTQQQLFYGDFNLAVLQQKLHHNSDAEALFKDAVAIGLKPKSGIAETDIGNTLLQLASLHHDQRKFEEAVGELRDVVVRTRASSLSEAIQALGLLQDSLWNLLRDDEAGAAAQDALNLAKHAAAPGSSEMYFALNTVALQDTYMEDLQDAEKMRRECLEHLQKYTVPENSNIVVQEWQLADILADEGKAGEALDVERQILAWYRQYNPKSEDVAIASSRIVLLQHLVATGRPAATQTQLSEILDAQRLRRNAARKTAAHQWTQAEDLYRKAVALADRALPPESPLLGGLLYDTGIFFYDEERFAEAKPFLSRASAIFEIDQPYQREMYGKALEGLAGVDEHLGEPALAEARWHDALALFKAAHLEDAYSGIVALHNYGAFLRDQSRFKKAEVIFRRILAMDEATYGPEHPETTADLNSLGYLYLQWGRYADAAQALHRALVIQEKNGGPPTETKTFVLINLASLAQDEGHYALAEEFHRHALSMREQLYGKNSAQAARTLRTIADDKLLEWRLPEAEALARQAIALGEASGDTVRYQTSSAWQLLGRIEANEQRPEDAVASMGKAVALDTALVNADQRGLLDSLFSQANALLWTGKSQDAIKIADRALAAAKRTFSAASPGPLAAAYDKAADFRALAGYPEEASDLLGQALAIRVQLFGGNSLAAADNEVRLVPYLLEQGRVREADRASKQALAALQQALGHDNPNLALFLDAEASVSIALGHVQAAEVPLRHALQLQEAALPADSPVIVPTLTALANDLAIQGRAQEAESIASRALKITEAATGSTSPGLIGPLESMANVLSLEGKPGEALDTGRRALQVALNVFGAHHPATAGAMRIVGNGLARSKVSHGDAKTFLEGAIAIDKAAPAPVNFWLAADLNDLALIEESDEELAKARDHLHQSVEIFDRAGFVDSLSMAVALANLARVDTALGIKPEAASAAALSVGIFQQSGADQTHRDRAL